MHAGGNGGTMPQVAEETTLNGMPITARLEGGWVEMWDDSSSSHFYGHPETGTTTWERPTQSTGKDMVLSPRAQSTFFDEL